MNKKRFLDVSNELSNSSLSSENIEDYQDACPYCNSNNIVFREREKQHYCGECFIFSSDKQEKIISFSVEDFYRNSRFLYFFFKTIGTKIFLNRHYSLIIAFFLLFVGIFTVASYVEDTLILDENNSNYPDNDIPKETDEPNKLNDHIGWLEDYVWQADIIWFCLFFLLIHRFLNQVVDLFSIKGKVLSLVDWDKISIKEYNEKISKEIDFINGRFGNDDLIKKGLFYLISWGSIPVVIYSGIYKQYNEKPVVDIWHLTHYPLGYYSWIIFLIFFVVFLAIPLIWRFIAVLISIRKITDTAYIPLKLNVLAADNVGGLKPLGDLAFTYYLLGLSTLLPIIVWIFVREISGMILFFLPIAIPFMLLSLILPVTNIHSAIQIRKDRELSLLANEFRYHYLCVRKNVLDREFNPETESHMDALEKISTLYDRVNSVSVWPFETRIIVQILTAAALPISIIVTQILNYYLGWNIELQ